MKAVVRAAGSGVGTCCWRRRHGPAWFCWAAPGAQAWHLPLALGGPAVGSCSANTTGQWCCPRRGWGMSPAAPSLGLGLSGAGGKGPSHIVVPLAERECPKCGTSREVPAALGQPEGPCGGLPGGEEAAPELSSPTQQLRQETETRQPVGQRQASAPEPQRGQPQAHEDIPQQELEPAQVLASIQALQLDLDFCRGTNRERLVQLQQQECAVEQKHQDLIFLMQQYLTLMDKDQKDEAVQTEVTSYVATHSHSNSSCEILREHRELLQQVVADAEATCCRQEGTAEEHGHEADCVVAAELRARQQQVGSSTAEQAQSRRAELAGGCPQPQPERGSACACSLEGGQPGAALLSPCPCRRELAAQLQAELSQWQWKQQVTLEQAVQHMHAAAHAAEKLQRSQEQLQVLKEQLGAQEEQSQGLRHSLAQLQEELGAAQAQEQQSLQQLSRAKETIQDLQQEVASKRKHLAELVQQVQDMATLQAELARAQQEKAKQEEKIANYEEQRQQLHWELRKLQGSQEQSKQEVCPKPPRVHQEPTLSQSHCLCHPQAQSLRERLQELSSQAQHWQQLHQDSEQALAAREEELVVCKVELAFLKEELSKAMEQVETLGCSHALACSDSSRLCKDRELVLVNISQCVKEQMHLQDSLGRLWENKCLTVRTCEQHHTCEELKASRIPSTAWPRTGPGQQLCAYRGGWAMAELPLPQHGPETGWLRPPGQYNSVPCPRIYRGTTGQCQPHTILHGCLHPALASRTRCSANQSQD
ncbi:polyamine-modulated factor 1-binding protein 1 isoform X3 [Columba livia]|uniref:polyamine-modulated factor 1-binding protein 1 isoform X3 n=1 Tax=Columba livia TaxID=8932 RepID=UPI0031BB4DA5